MADKSTALSIVIRTVDQATAKIKAINDRIDAVTKPIRNLKEALGDLREKSGLDEVVNGFKGVGSAVAGMLAKVAMIGGVVGLAVAGLFRLVNEFDDLGKSAARLGVGVDFLAGMRYAAQKTGAPVEDLNAGLETFSTNMGRASAGTGRMVKFLSIVSPELLKQLKAAHGNAEAFDLVAGAMAKLTDPAKRAALATAAFGDAKLAPLLAQGPAALKDLRERFVGLAGSQEGAAGSAGKVHDAMVDLDATTQGLKASLVEGLAPALTMIVQQLTEWFQSHRGDVKQWAIDIGKKLPDAVNTVVAVVSGAVETVTDFVDSIGGLKTVALVLAAVIVGPVISAIGALGIALLTTPVGWIVAALAAIAAAAYEIYKHWGAIADFFSELWDGIKAVFTGFFSWLWNVLKTYTPIGIFVDNWQPIADFFKMLWDTVTGIFKDSWALISYIVDKVVGSVAKIKDAVGSIKDSIGELNPFGSSTGDEIESAVKGAQRRGLVDADGNPALDIATYSRNLLFPEAQPGAAATAKVTVAFANAPIGMRVSTDPSSTADIDTTTGYQLFGGAP